MIRKAFILAGGEGTRLRPVTFEIPKPLITVRQKPILTWQVEWLARAGVESVCVSIPPKWQAVFEKWRAEQGGTQIDLWTEPEPMGTMGAFVHHLRERMGSDPVFVSNGDELKGFDLKRLEQFHEERQADSPGYGATIALVGVPNPSEYGVAELDGYHIRRFHEKPADPPTNLISSGFYVLNPSALDEAARDKTFLMFEKDLFPSLAHQSRLGGCHVDGPWYDCGTMERWEKAIREWPAFT